MKVRINRIDRLGMENERVLMEVMEDCNLSHYLLFDNTYSNNGILSNLSRHVYFFNAKEVKKGDFISLFTRKKRVNDKDSFSNKRKTTTYQLFWGLDKEIWNNVRDSAYLLHYDDWMVKNAEESDD